MKIGDIISDLRSTIKAHSDDSNYTDEYLYNLIKSYRSLFLKRKYEQRKTTSPMVWQTICLPVKRTKYHDCSCIDIGCDILKSERTIPPVIVGRNKPFIKVRNFDGTSIPYITPDRAKTNKHSNILSDVVGYYIQNRKLILWNTLSIKAILVDGIMEDPSTLATYAICDEDGVLYGACSYDPLNDEFPIDQDLVPDVRLSVLKELGISLGIQEDTTNDSQTNL